MKKIFLILALMLLTPVLIWQQVRFWGGLAQAADSTTTTSDSSSTVDTSGLDKSISKIQDKIDAAKKAKAKLEQNLGQIQSQVAQTQQVINQHKNVIQQANQTLSQKEQDIQDLNDQIELQKALLTSFVQQIYYTQNQPELNLVLVDGNLKDILGNTQNYMSLNDKISKTIDDIHDLQAQVEQDKVDLNQLKQQHEEIVADQTDQKQNLLADQSQVQAQIQDKATTISQLQSQLNSLKAQYSAALGQSVSTDDIVAAAKFAAGATNMNKSFLLGVLVQESNKGQNVGGCNYKSSRMPAAQLTAFKSITKDLGYDYTKKPVSCPSNAYKGTGGAMGVAQFMPTTWQGYESTIASLSGHNPPDPWNLVDGVVAMASKLSNDGADSKKRFDEAKSYCIYLAGGNWGHYCYGKPSQYRDDYSDMNCSGSQIHNYGERVLCLKDNYDKYY